MIKKNKIDKLLSLLILSIILLNLLILQFIEPSTNEYITNTYFILKQYFTIFIIIITIAIIANIKINIIKRATIILTILKTILALYLITHHTKENTKLYNIAHTLTFSPYLIELFSILFIILNSMILTNNFKSKIHSVLVIFFLIISNSLFFIFQINADKIILLFTTLTTQLFITCKFKMTLFIILLIIGFSTTIYHTSPFINKKISNSLGITSNNFIKYILSSIFIDNTATLNTKYFSLKPQNKHIGIFLYYSSLILLTIFIVQSYKISTYEENYFKTVVVTGLLFNNGIIMLINLNSNITLLIKEFTIIPPIGYEYSEALRYSLFFGIILNINKRLFYEIKPSQ